VRSLPLPSMQLRANCQESLCRTLYDSAGLLILQPQLPARPLIRAAGTHYRGPCNTGPGGAAHAGLWLTGCREEVARSFEALRKLARDKVCRPLLQWALRVQQEALALVDCHIDGVRLAALHVLQCAPTRIFLPCALPVAMLAAQPAAAAGTRRVRSCGFASFPSVPQSSRTRANPGLRAQAKQSPGGGGRRHGVQEHRTLMTGTSWAVSIRGCRLVLAGATWMLCRTPCRRTLRRPCARS
jgi:hypothetical protein